MRVARVVLVVMVQVRVVWVMDPGGLDVEWGEIQKKRRGNHFEKGERSDEFKFFGTSKVEFLMMGLIRIGVANR